MSLDPTIGRWISEDPIGFTAADPNLYRCVGNDPVNATDPTGLYRYGRYSREFNIAIDADGATGNTGRTRTGRSNIGIVIQVLVPKRCKITDLRKIKVFQAVRTEIYAMGHGKGAYLDIRSPAKSDGKPTLHYVNPPDKPVWGIDAPSDRSTTYWTPQTTGQTEYESYLEFRDFPGMEAYYKSFSKDFLKHEIASASFKTYFKFLVEYDGKVVAELNWECSASWSNGPAYYTLVGPTPWHWQRFKWEGYTINGATSNLKGAEEVLD